MTRQIVITVETYGRLCEIAAAVRLATGVTLEFGEIVDMLAGGYRGA